MGGRYRKVHTRRTDERLGRPSRDPDAQEEAVGRTLKGRVQPGSGCGPLHKGDYSQAPERRPVLSGAAPVPEKRIDFLVECKQTVHASRSVKWQELKKISEEARALGKHPLFEIEFKGATSVLDDQKWVMMPRKVFDELMEDLGVEP
tara:strand:+ start:8870 stop:9310 length:441 start_codon:yes stop_codon:yes gene_type:complete